MSGGVLGALTDRARKRPWAILGGHLAVLAILAWVALAGPGELTVGSLRLEDPGEVADLVVATRSDQPTSSRFYETSLDVVESGISTDPAVESVRRGPEFGRETVTYLAVELNTDDSGEQHEAVERIRDQIDAGALRIFIGGETPTLIEARETVIDDLWRLELLAVPVIALTLLLLLGARVAAVATLAAATGIVGALALIRVIGVVGDVSLLGIAPAGIVSLALAAELAPRIAEGGGGPPGEPRHGWHDAPTRLAVLAAAAALAAALGWVPTLLDQGASLAMAVGVAAALTALGALIATPAVLALGGSARTGIEAARSPRRQPTGGGSRLNALREVPARIAASGWLAALVALAAIATTIFLAVPSVDGETRPLSSSDLRADSEPRRAESLVAGLAGKDPRQAGGKAGVRDEKRSKEAKAADGLSPLGIDAGPGDSLYPELPLAATVSALLLALLFGAVTRSLRSLVPAALALLPAAAACGLGVLAFQNGDGAGLLGFREQDALETGALAAAACALAAVGAARSMIGVVATPGAGVAPVSLRGALAGTVVAGIAAGVLVGVDLYSVREFGLLVAAGLVIDLVAIRIAVAPALSRWRG